MNYHEYRVIVHILLVEILVSMLAVVDEVVVDHIRLPVMLPILCVLVDHIRKNLESHVKEEISIKHVQLSHDEY